MNCLHLDIACVGSRVHHTPTTCLMFRPRRCNGVPNYGTRPGFRPQAGRCNSGWASGSAFGKLLHCCPCSFQRAGLFQDVAEGKYCSAMLKLLCQRSGALTHAGFAGAGPNVFWSTGMNNPQSWEQLARMWGVSVDPAKIQEMMRDMERGQSPFGNVNQVRPLPGSLTC